LPRIAVDVLQCFPANGPAVRTDRVNHCDAVSRLQHLCH
jgi:hypothetical protein